MLIAVLAGSAAHAVAQSKPVQIEQRFRAVTPLGSDSILLMPAHKILCMMLTYDSKELENARLVVAGDKRAILSSDGFPLESYPRELRLRFSIGSRNQPTEKDPLELETNASVDDFSSHLNFRLKVFDGLDSKLIDPEKVKIIGVPRDIPYDERIYSVVFRIPQVPVSDRFMIEVLDASGSRVGKFHLQLM